MPFSINWNNLYATKPRKRRFVAARIYRHLELYGFTCDEISSVNVRYVFQSWSLDGRCLPGFCRPTGWHGESASDPYQRGHLTIRLVFVDGTYETHHVYQCDEAYQVY